MKTEKEKILAGELYNPLDAELMRARERARDLCHEESVGFDAEMNIYWSLYDLFLHQGTTTNVAYAVVPWLVSNLSRSDVPNRTVYLSDVGLVELRRLTCGVYFLREGGDAEPSWLMPDYHQAIIQAQLLSEDVLDEPLPEEVRKPLWQSVPALYGNAELAQKRMWRRR